MNQLLGQDVMNTISIFPCVPEREHAEPKRAMEAGEMRLFVLRSGGAGSGSGLPVDYIVRKRMVGLFYRRVSPVQFLTYSVTASGQCDARRHGVVLRSGLLSQSRSGPLSRMHDLALGSRAHSHGFAQV